MTKAWFPWLSFNRKIHSVFFLHRENLFTFLCVFGFSLFGVIFFGIGEGEGVATKLIHYSVRDVLDSCNLSLFTCLTLKYINQYKMENS